MIMSDTPTQRKSPPKFARALAAHERRARLIAQLHEQAIAAASDLTTKREPISASTARDVERGKAEAWFCAGVFLLALGCIIAAGCVLATVVSWQ
jgi:hypothetical protein